MLSGVSRLVASDRAVGNRGGTVVKNAAPEFKPIVAADRAVINGQCSPVQDPTTITLLGYGAGALPLFSTRLPRRTKVLSFRIPPPPPPR